MPYQRFCEQLAAEAAAEDGDSKKFVQFQRVFYRGKSFFIFWCSPPTEYILIDVDNNFKRICAPKGEIEPLPFDADEASKFFTKMSKHFSPASIFATNIGGRL